MTANADQASSPAEPDPGPTIIPAAVAVVQSLGKPNGMSWTQVAEYCQDCVRVGVSGHELALLIERMICHGVLNDID